MPFFAEEGYDRTKTHLQLHSLLKEVSQYQVRIVYLPNFPYTPDVNRFVIGFM